MQVTDWRSRRTLQALSEMKICWKLLGVFHTQQQYVGNVMLEKQNKKKIHLSVVTSPCWKRKPAEQFAQCCGFSTDVCQSVGVGTHLRTQKHTQTHTSYLSNSHAWISNNTVLCLPDPLGQQRSSKHVFFSSKLHPWKAVMRLKIIITWSMTLLWYRYTDTVLACGWAPVLFWCQPFPEDLSPLLAAPLHDSHMNAVAPWPWMSVTCVWSCEGNVIHTSHQSKSQVRPFI